MSKIFETPLYPYQRTPDQDASPTARHKVVVIGAGPVGLALAIDLAQQGVPVLVLDDNDRVSFGSRAICFAKRPLEILDRLGCGEEMVEKGVLWDTGRVFVDEDEAYSFNLLTESGHKNPAFINLQQYTFEEKLLARLRALQDEGAPIDLRGKNKVTALADNGDHVRLEVDTPEGSYLLEADWLVACDGANSPTRKMLGHDFKGRVFEDNFLIADVIMQADFPAERWFWFDPPFNRGQSALLHKQPDNVWRIDFQIGQEIDREEELKPEKIKRRLRAMLGEAAEFELEWTSIYSFQCRRMDKFRYGRTLFAGDAAHQVSPFGARGANSGLQDSDNLAWKLKLVIEGTAPETLLDSYSDERVHGAEENILNSTRSTDFITPKSKASRTLRDAVLALARQHAFARPLVNSGRLSVPCTYDGSVLNGPEVSQLPADTRPGAPMKDADTGAGWLLDKLGNRFQLLGVNIAVPAVLEVDGIIVDGLTLPLTDSLKARYLGDVGAAVYLLRPDQHVAARWLAYDETAVKAALRTAIGKG